MYTFKTFPRIKRFLLHFIGILSSEIIEKSSGLFKAGRIKLKKLFKKKPKKEKNYAENKTELTSLFFFEAGAKSAIIFEMFLIFF